MGVYIRLLCLQWTNGGLPKCEKKLQKICKKTPKKFQKIWKILSEKFVDHPTKNDEIINLRLEETRQEQIDYRLRQSEAGRRGADVKKKKKQQRVAADSLQGSLKQPLPSGLSRKQALQSSPSINTPPTPLFKNLESEPELITAKIELFNSCFTKNGIQKNLPTDDPDKRGILIEFMDYSLEDHRRVYDFVSSSRGWANQNSCRFLTFEIVHRHFKKLLEQANLPEIKDSRESGHSYSPEQSRDLANQTLEKIARLPPKVPMPESCKNLEKELRA